MRAKIRARRRKLGMTQAELAKRVNVSRHAIAQFENGHLSLSPATIEKLCDVLDIDCVERALGAIRQHGEALGQAIDALYSQVEA
jgi:transcriptional regulator with XRE-family HTH domain